LLQGLTFDIYKVKGAFGPEGAPRYCQRLAETGFPAASHTLSRDVRLRDIWSAAKGFCKVHKWCPGPSVPSDTSANCAGFGDFIVKEILRLASCDTLVSSGDDEDASESTEAEEPQQRKAAAHAARQAKASSSQVHVVKEEDEEDEEEEKTKVGFKTANLGPILETTEFADNHAWYRCGWAGPYSARADSKERPRFRKGWWLDLL
jgi:hypothetical protein